MTDREAFEAWAAENHYDTRDPHDPALVDAWQGWKARAARAQPAQAVPSDVVRAVVICTECGGHGQVTVASGTVGWPPRMQVVTCQSCDGTGRTEAIAAQGEKPCVI